MRNLLYNFGELQRAGWIYWLLGVKMDSTWGEDERYDCLLILTWNPFINFDVKDFPENFWQWNSKKL